MKSFFNLIFAGILLTACNHTSVKESTTGNAVEEIKQAEIAFSNLSEKVGMKKAFLQYIDSSAVLLRGGHKPIVGEAARNFLSPINDSSFTLTWVPSAVFAAASGDMGYAYGIYTYKDKDTTTQGTYVSIWKKQSDGSWKYVLDTGNQGIEN